MELCVTLETAEHRYHLFQVRYHRQELVDIDIQHVVVESYIEVVTSRRAVDSGQLQFGGVTDESDLVEDQFALLDK